MYDIAIIGAGPAGATLARLIGKYRKVLLIDRRPLEKEPLWDSAGKCCGGLVAPDAQKLLAELGLGLPNEVLAGPQLFVVRTIDLQRSLEKYYQRFYINIDREKFDRWLVSMIPACVDMRFGSLFKCYEGEEGEYKVRFTSNGKEYVETAKILVGADGASSLLRKQAFGSSNLPPKYIAIQEWFEMDKTLPYFSAIFDREVTDFYSWTIPKERFLIVGAALHPKDDPHSRFLLLKDKIKKYGFELGRPVKKEGAFILRPLRRNHVYTGKGGIVLLGEAAGWISPSSSEGLSYAFRSAISLAGSLKGEQADLLKCYNRNTNSIRKNIFVKNLKSPFMYNPLLRAAVMNSGIQSVDVCDT